MSNQPFDPARHLSLVSGKEYLEVRWRLVWLRSDHPNAVIDTELVFHDLDAKLAIFKAYVKIPDGGSATGFGSEDAKGFGDYLEKAETKAIGRALAALGYGTQFCSDFDFGASQGRVVDSPVQLHGERPQQSYQGNGGGNADQSATDRQRTLIQALARDLKLSGNALDEFALTQTGVGFNAITRKSASTLIEALKQEKASRAMGDSR